jgi:hypothetical protein
MYATAATSSRLKATLILSRTTLLNLFTAFFDGFISVRLSHLRMLKPRKSNPSSAWVMSVFSADNLSFSVSRRNVSVSRFIRSASSRLRVRMTQSSAYRTMKQGHAWLYLPALYHRRYFSGSVAQKLSMKVSNSLRYTLASRGDNTDPCGTPTPVSISWPKSITPALSILRITLMRLSSLMVRRRIFKSTI